MNKMMVYYDKSNETPVGRVESNLQSNDWLSRKIDWITFYRRNIHRFIQHYFNIKLHTYQILWIYFMSICDYFITIASRASAKSWLIGVFALAIADLYPHSEVVIVSSTQKTAAVVMGKIGNLMSEYPNIARDIDYYSNTSNNRICRMKNSSTIKVVACRDSGRGERSSFTIGEEFRMMDKNNYDSIVKPFAYARQSPYMKLQEWQNLPPEEPKEVLISSAYHKGLWWYDETKKCIKGMLNGLNYGFIAFDYELAIYHKIKTARLIQKEKSTMDFITFQEEYCNIPFGENSDAYFKLSMFDCRNIRKAFYPQRTDTYSAKKNPYGMKKIEGELRAISADIASRSGKKNDNTIITCTRLLPTLEGYNREVVYIESHNGENTWVQALRIKQLFYDFEADYFVLDIQNAGMNLVVLPIGDVWVINCWKIWKAETLIRAEVLW